MHHAKKPVIAGILNFIMPGLGLLYLGCWKAALINFALVNITFFVFTVLIADPTLIEHVHYLILGLAALSAGYAHGVASSKQRTDEDVKHGFPSS